MSAVHPASIGQFPAGVSLKFLSSANAGQLQHNCVSRDNGSSFSSKLTLYLRLVKVVMFTKSTPDFEICTLIVVEPELFFVSFVQTPEVLELVALRSRHQ